MRLSFNLKLRVIQQPCQKICASALGPQKIRAVAKTELADKKDRSKNLIVYELEASKEEQLKTMMIEVLGQINEKPQL